MRVLVRTEVVPTPHSTRSALQNVELHHVTEAPATLNRVLYDPAVVRHVDGGHFKRRLQLYRVRVLCGLHRGHLQLLPGHHTDVLAAALTIVSYHDCHARESLPLLARERVGVLNAYFS